MRGAVYVAAWGFLIAGVIGGCGASMKVTAQDPLSGSINKCVVETPSEKPLLVDWPSAERGTLEALARKHTIVVHYVGCDFKVLDRCSSEGAYKYSGFTRKHDRLVIKTANELYASIPANAVKLEGKLKAAGELSVDMTAVGRLVADKPHARRDELQGDCDGATHIVSALTAGAFKFTMGEDATASANLSVLGRGAGGNHEVKKDVLNEDGQEDACAVAQDEDTRPPPNCGALLRVEVLPLGEARVAQVQCPAGTLLKGGQCVGMVNTTCPPAMVFQEGRGCASPIHYVNDPRCPFGMAFVEGGKKSSNTRKNKAPATTIAPFCMDMNEVTMSDFRQCATEGRCSVDRVHEATLDGQHFSPSDECNYGHDERGEHPMNCVDWGQSAAYCHAKNAKLPSDEQWEWAARRASGGAPYPWGDAEPEFQLCWSGVEKRGGTCPVRSFPTGRANGALYDLVGNVWEWTSTKSEEEFSARFTRGGGWNEALPSLFRTTYRFSRPVEIRASNLGFRCIADPSAT